MADMRGIDLNLLIVLDALLDERSVTRIAIESREATNCDIGRASSGRPLPDPTADLSTLSVLAKESDRP